MLLGSFFLSYTSTSTTNGVGMSVNYLGLLLSACVLVICARSFREATAAYTSAGSRKAQLSLTALLAVAALARGFAAVEFLGN